MRGSEGGGGEESRGGKRRGVKGGAWKGGEAGRSLWVAESIEVGAAQKRDGGDVATSWGRVRRGA